MYYWKLVEHFEKQLVILNTHIEEAEAIISPSKSNKDFTQQEFLSDNVSSAPAIERIIRSQNSTFMRIAGEVALIHELVNVFLFF